MSLVEIHRLLRRAVQPQWHHIPPTSSEEWRNFAASTTLTRPAAQLRGAQSSLLHPTTDGTANFFPETSSSISPATDSDTGAPPPGTTDAVIEAGLNALSSKRRMLLLVQAAAMLETPWAVAQVRLRGIEEARKSRPLHLEELISYARRLGGTTTAPPESANVTDPAAHETVYPSFHFLPFPSLEELQASRLSFLQSRNYGRSCFPPEIRPRLVYDSRIRSSSRNVRGETGDDRYETSSSYITGENSQQMRRTAAGFQLHFFCQTSGATVNYKVVERVVSGAAAAEAWSQTEAAQEQIYDPQRPPVITLPFPKTILARTTHPSLSPSGVRALCLKLRVAPTSSSKLRAAVGAAYGTRTVGAQRAALGLVGTPHEGREALPAGSLLRMPQQQQQSAVGPAEGSDTSAAQAQRLHLQQVARLTDSETMEYLRKDAGARRDSIQQQQSAGGTPGAATAAFQGLLLGTARRQRRRAEKEQEEEASEDSDDSSSSSSSGNSSEEEGDSADKRTEKS